MVKKKKKGGNILSINYIWKPETKTWMIFFFFFKQQISKQMENEALMSDKITAYTDFKY